MQIMAPETAAHTISWILYCIATHPEAEAQLLAELKAAGLPCNGDLDAALAVLSQSFDALKGLPFLEAIINEAMRLYPAGASASPRYVCCRLCLIVATVCYCSIQRTGWHAQIDWRTPSANGICQTWNGHTVTASQSVMLVLHHSFPPSG